MSNLSTGPPDNLYRHERTHVWQNRIFGPFYTLSYLGWMAVWVLPGLIAGSIVGAGAFQGAEKWCYFNNPWEVMAYRLADPSDRMGWNKPRWLCWPWPVAIALAPPVLAAIAALFIDLFATAYT